MSSFRTLLCVIAALVAVVAGILLFFPSEFRVERSVRISAPADRVFALASDLGQNLLWPPPDTSDPGLHVVHGKVTQGPGATYFWIDGRDNHGMIRLREIVPERSITADLDLADCGKGEGAITFVPDSGGVEVTETFRKGVGNNLVARVFHPSYEREVGAMMEKSLSNLRRKAEIAPPAEPSPVLPSDSAAAPRL